MNKRNAFTLVEIMMAMFMMAIVILGLFTLNQSSSKSSMDAYYQMLAYSLAREPIEVFRGFGFDVVNKFYKKEIPVPAPYNIIGEYVDIYFNPKVELQYPNDAEFFQRRIDLKPIDGGKAFLITVSVSRKGSTKAELWMRNKNIVLKSIIMERKKW
jgi:type II secretory pathway pseudopilin PulG